MSISGLRVDVRDALRGLRAGRGTTVLAVLILTLTMAAATVTFSIVDAVALRPLPYASPDRLVGISLTGTTPDKPIPASPEYYFTWRDETWTLDAVAAAHSSRPLQMETDGASEDPAAARTGVPGVGPGGHFRP